MTKRPKALVIRALCLAGALCAAQSGHALAQEAPVAEPATESAQAPSEALTFGGEVTLLTDYRARGVSFSGGEPSAHLSLFVAHESGFYAGAFVGTLGDFDPEFGGLEVDYYAGWAGEVGAGITLDASLLYVSFPEATVASGFEDGVFEATIIASKQFGPMTLNAGYANLWAQEALGNVANHYWYVGGSAPVQDGPVSVRWQVGYTDGSFAADPDLKSWDWSIGATYSFAPQLDLRADLSGVEGPVVDGFSDDAFVVSVAYTF